MRNIEDVVADIAINQEVETAKRNQAQTFTNYEASIDMFECKRTEYKAKWMSDIFLPEYPSHVLTDTAMFTVQYFGRRDFVECYMMDESAEAEKKADASKECLNRTLNQRHLYYFQKLARARMIARAAGNVYTVCRWQEAYEPTKAVRKIAQPVINSETGETEDFVTSEQEYDTERKTIDRFNFEVFDPRNVFTDNTFCYSIQDKPWVTLRYERTYYDLLGEEKDMGYFNLEKVEELQPPIETDTSVESFNKNSNKENFNSPVKKNFDVYERHGLFWAIIKERDSEGYPSEIEFGIDEEGKPKDKAELIETILTIVTSNNAKVIIRFQPQPYRDAATGAAYKPIIRGLYYQHHSKDSGIGDDILTKELQIAMNDTFNIGQDRVMMATQPTFLVKKYAHEDSPELYFAPGHAIPLENPNEDFKEIKISDNVQGALQQINVLKGMMQQADAIFPTTLGQTGGGGITATAIAGADARSNARALFKSLTFEYTYLNELYWMILNMTWQFSSKQTVMQMLGDKAYNFDPTKDYYYKPISSAIESEYSSAAKKKELITLFGYIVSVPNPNTAKLANAILAEIFRLSGDENIKFGKMLFDETAPMTQQQAEGGNPNQQATMPTGMPTSNQSQIPMSGMETMARGV